MPSAPRRHRWVGFARRGAVLGALVVGPLVALMPGCGHGPADRDEPTWEPVSFPASDGIRLDGRLFGQGELGVVLAHMGREGDSQLDWVGVARLLSSRGYIALTYNRRGVCPGGPAGCSKGIDDYALSWKDIVGAEDFLLERGAERIVVIGASIGAMASLHAAAIGAIQPVGLVEFGGINHASGYDFTREQIRAIGGRKLFLSARDDIYGGGEAAREWYEWARSPKRLELLPGSEHGTDLLRAESPLRRRVETLILEFVDEIARRGP